MNYLFVFHFNRSIKINWVNDDKIWVNTLQSMVVVFEPDINYDSSLLECGIL